MKNDNSIWVIIIIGGILLYMGSQGMFKSEAQFGNLNIVDLFKQEPSEECTFVLDSPIDVCVGDNVVGTLNAKSPVCYIGFNYNNEGWKFAGLINEVSPGFYRESRQTTVIGHYEFAAICGTPADFCRTNNVEVDVIPCDDNGDETPTYTCGWIEKQCGGTCPSTHPLCVDVWFEQNVLWLNDGYVECVCLDPDTEEIHPDWKPDGIYHDNEDPFDEFPNGDGMTEEICDDKTDSPDVWYSEYNVLESECEQTGIAYCTAVGYEFIGINFDSSCCWVECGDLLEEPELTIGTYCGDLGFNRHWDTNLPSNCPQAAINYCEPLGYDNEYFYDYEKEWCCYKCVERVEPNCDDECFIAGYSYGGWYSGGVSCNDFELYLPGPQCCCETLYTFCVSSCYASGFDNSIPFIDTGWNCAAWADVDCPSSFNSMDDGTCCCWNCN